MGEYISANLYEVDPKQFYRDFGVNIQGVSRACGISRASISRVPAECASNHTTRRVIEYLEEVSVEDYEYVLRSIREQMESAIVKIEEAWNDYKSKEERLDHYRTKYGILRRKPMAARVMATEILKEVRDEK